LSVATSREGLELLFAAVCEACFLASCSLTVPLPAPLS
jgi:hypothetical protein